MAAPSGELAMHDGTGELSHPSAVHCYGKNASFLSHISPTPVAFLPTRSSLSATHLTHKSSTPACRISPHQVILECLNQAPGDKVLKVDDKVAARVVLVAMVAEREGRASQIEERGAKEMGN